VRTLTRQSENSHPPECEHSLSVRKTISTPVVNEAPKAHYFCFLLLIQRSAVQQKSNKATLPNTTSLFYCKTPVVRAISMFIASQ